MKTEIIKLHYPSLDANGIGEVTAAIRDSILDVVASNQLSFSFSYNKESGYIMVYPTAPILSIRVSNHGDRGESVDRTDAVIESANTLVVNAESEIEPQNVEKIVQDKIMDAVRRSSVIKQTIRNHE